MWYLTSENDDRVIYVIPERQQITIGRSVDNEVCNFAIPNDASISRKHATLALTDNSLFLQDLGSRYGTFINDSTDKAESNTNIELKENDVIKFGKITSVWKVNAASLNTCTSTLKGENLQKLRMVLSRIGGQLKNEWDDSCNYLTMPAITLTIKVVLALVQGAHIVTTDFWTKFVESVTNFTPIPDPAKYMPEIVESTLNKEVVSFSPDECRKSLFDNKKFVFFARRQYEMYKPVLLRSGATPLLLGECKMTVSMLCEDNVVVIQYTASAGSQETQAQRNQINEIVAQLKNKGKRVIADAEIGLAILYCSTEKYCNPKFSFTSEVVKQNSTEIKTSKVLAQESQDPAEKNDKENVKINETYTDDKNRSPNVEKLANKRKLSDFTSDVQVNHNKKAATACLVANIPNEGIKRRLSDDDTSPNPSKKIAFDKEINDQGSSNSSDDILLGKENSDDIFNFINPVATNTEIKLKKLNLSRPQKRKVDTSNEDGDLFNFEKTDEDKVTEGESSKQSTFSSNKVKRSGEADTSNVRNRATKVELTSEDISAMRGVKLKELMASNTFTNATMDDFSVKKETSEDLEDKMGGLDLGNTIVITCHNLIVKKESFKIEAAEDSSLSVKNFKKFKKVWPVRKQVTIIPPSSMAIGDLADTEICSAAY